jgi:hypothetical protein
VRTALCGIKKELKHTYIFGDKKRIISSEGIHAGHFIVKK